MSIIETQINLYKLLIKSIAMYLFRGILILLLLKMVISYKLYLRIFQGIRTILSKKITEYIVIMTYIWLYIRVDIMVIDCHIYYIFSV